MRLKKLLTMALAGTLLIGGVVTAHGAELDFAWYAENNPDVVAELGNSPEALRQHYEMHGRKEGRMANNHDAEAKLRRLFNAEEYGTLYPDVKEFYGADEEAMFQHYISFGLLEARRPSEKVSQAAAVSLKKSVEKALTDAGIAAVPGSAEVAALIEGTVSDVAQSAEAAKALTQVAAVVEDAVAETYEEVTNPKPAPSGGGSGSSSSSSSGSGSTTTPEEPSTPDTPDEPTTTVSAGDPAVWATLAGDISVSGNDVPENFSDLNNTTVQNETQSDGIVKVSFPGDTKIPVHKNPGNVEACWVGIGVPYVTEGGNTYTYSWGWADESGNLKGNGSGSPTNTMEKSGKKYATFYWGWQTAAKKSENTKGCLTVKKGDAIVAKYFIDFSNISCIFKSEGEGES